MIFVVVMVSMVSGAIGGWCAAMFLEAWWLRQSERQLTVTEFYEDQQDDVSHPAGW